MLLQIGVVQNYLFDVQFVRLEVSVRLLQNWYLFLFGVLNFCIFGYDNYGGNDDDVDIDVWC